MSLVRNKGCKWLLIQVQFGFAKSWTDLNKPQYRRPKAIPTISTKEKPSATLKRAFDDTDFPTTKKPTTTTGRMLADLENKVRAEEGTYNGVMTEIQIKWVCKRASCNNYDKFCWVNNDRHHYLSAEHLRRWATEIRSNSYDSDISLPSRDQRLDLQKEFRERQLSRSLREDAQNERRRNNYPTRASEVAPVMYPRPTMYGSPAPIQAHPTYYPPTPWHHQYGSFYPSLQPPPRPFYSIQQEVNSWNSPTPFQQPPLLAFQSPPPQEPSLPPNRPEDTVVEPALSMASLRESSPIRGDLDIREQLADFKQWLVEKLPLNRQAKLTFVMDIAEEQWWDVDQIKRLSNQDAFDWKIPTGLLQLIKKEVSGFKKAFKSETDVH